MKNSLPLPVTAINHVSIRASDPERSKKWFRDLFGFSIIARQGDTDVMGVADGPNYMQVLSKPDKKTGYTHFGLAIEDFDLDAFCVMLKDAGLTQSDFPHPHQFTVRNRGTEKGGASEGTPEVYIGDPDGIIVQVQDATYCGGSGLKGNIGYAMPEPSSNDALLKPIELNHCTLLVSDGKKSLEFYQKIFDLPVDTYQGPTPILRVGTGNASIVLYELPDDAADQGVFAGIDHVCFAIEDFDVDRVEKVLGDYGLKVLGETWRPTGPLQTYYTDRMPDRGGDPHGTKELYFTDHDFTVVQLQDQRYAGGCGCLGEKRGTGVKHPF